MPETKLDKFSKEYLAGFDPQKPMVWQLRLPYARFEELEALVAHSSVDEMMRHPLAALVYLAEWYKWRYKPGNKVARHFNPTGEQIKQLLNEAGVDINQWVAVNPETGRHSWLYSVYVLGGLPVAHENSRKADSRFLRTLCRLYHGGSLQPGDEIDGSGRAEAFRMSLKEGSSLYEFIREIVNGENPFASEDTKEGLSPASQLIFRIINANNEVRRDKFRLEWLITAPMGGRHFSRRLRLNLLPEITGEGLSQYLMYDRILLWGIENPSALKWLEIGVRFKRGDKTLTEFPSIISYTNTFNSEQGFLSWGVDQSVTVRDVPVGMFDTIEVFATADNGVQAVAQSEKMDSCFQLYKTDNPGEWSDTTASQRETAVLWHEPWRLAMPIAEELNERRVFRNHLEGEGKIFWNLTLVPEALTLIAPDGTEVTFYNHQGYDRLTARTHHNLLRYEDGDKVKFYRPDEYGDEEELFLTVIFNRDDLLIIRTGLEEEESQIEKDVIEWKAGARFREWTDEDQPKSGIVKIRTACRGRYLIKEFLLMPGPIERNLTMQTILYPRGRWLDEPQLGNKPLIPTHEIRVDFEDGYALLDVWRPLRVKETIIGNRCYARTEEPTVKVPMMIAYQSEVAIFSETGYRRYLCYPQQVIYSALSREAKTSRVIDGKEMPAKDYDPIAPEELSMIMGFPMEKASNSTKWLFWNYEKGTEPQQSELDIQLPFLTILFQDYAAEKNPTNLYCIKRGSNHPFKQKAMLAKSSLLQCFLTAAKYHQYYFAFLPLELMNKEKRDKEIYEPLLELRNGILTDNDKAELARLDLEMGFTAYNPETI